MSIVSFIFASQSKLIGMKKLVFSPDIYRNYCGNDVNDYHNILLKLSNKCTYSFQILDTLVNPKMTHDSWATMQKDTTSIDSVYKEEALYVFFEIPEYIRNYFIFNKIPYINFMTSKLRFPGMEPCLMFESNFNIPVEEYREFPKYEPKILPEYKDKVVAIGQMDKDRSVIFDGKGYNLFDFEFEADIFRPHPNAILHQPLFSYRLERLARNKKLDIKSEGNIYDILYSAKKFIAISSSTLYEAKYIGKEVQFLKEKDYITAGKIIKWSEVNEDFWDLIKETYNEIHY